MIPLQSPRDLLARVGVRYLFATVPFLTISLMMENGFSRPVAFLFLFLPLAGAFIDWFRLSTITGVKAVD